MELTIVQIWAFISFYKRGLLQAVWPDWAIYSTLCNFLKPLAAINLPKSPTFLGNFCKGVKIYHFSSETIFGQLLYTFGDFFLATLLASVTRWLDYFSVSGHLYHIENLLSNIKELQRGSKFVPKFWSKKQPNLVTLWPLLNHCHIRLTTNVWGQRMEDWGRWGRVIRVNPSNVARMAAKGWHGEQEMVSDGSNRKNGNMKQIKVSDYSSVSALLWLRDSVTIRLDYFLRFWHFMPWKLANYLKK